MSRGARPRSPNIVVGPVFVTVEPPSTEKLAAVPRPTVAVAPMALPANTSADSSPTLTSAVRKILPAGREATRRRAARESPKTTRASMGRRGSWASPDCGVLLAAIEGEWLPGLLRPIQLPTVCWRMLSRAPANSNKRRADRDTPSAQGRATSARRSSPKPPISWRGGERRPSSPLTHGVKASRRSSAAGSRSDRRRRARTALPRRGRSARPGSGAARSAARERPRVRPDRAV